MRRVKSLISGFSAATLLTCSQAGAYDAIYAFGDSLSDVGNVYLSTGGVIPGSPYFNGRFTNGPNWLDYLSQKLNLGPVIPSLAGGNDYAFGGAVTSSAVPGASTPVPNIGQQVNLFSLSYKNAPQNSLYTMWIGANDVLAGLQDVSVNPATLGVIKTDLAAAAQSEAGALDVLSTEGALHFLVPLVPDIGLTPQVAGTALSPLATELTQVYNGALLTDLAQLEASSNIDVTVLDTFGFIDQAVANPGLFGFTDVSTACYGGSLAGGGSGCANPDQHLFWDKIHPTSAADLLLANAAFGQISAAPESSTWALMLVGFVGLSFAGYCSSRRGAGQLV